MDRVICGDVGFGKTEVALRAAFSAALNGKQVAVVVPTTLLARQHFKTFSRAFPRLCRQRRARLAAGERGRDRAREGGPRRRRNRHRDRHARATRQGREFKDLGLLVVDEEQHFGVAHKEKLKALRSEVHVLTLTATPIPRTLQLALTGVRDLSIIASPPVDRLAVRTFVSPFDALVVREALLRERYRGGQAFYVCPRIEDLGGRQEVPRQVGAGDARGRGAWTDAGGRARRHHDRVLRRQIRRVAVDDDHRIWPRHSDRQYADRAPRRSLRPGAALSIARAGGARKLRAYALLTLPAQGKITAQAERRLKVLQSLDTLGAGFQLASHDLDIRGAGNLLGEEQSGHIKEVGFELYQQMLEEAVLSLKAGITAPVADRWSPQITIGTALLIPEDYVADLSVRLALYRRLAEIEDEREIESFAAELVDRFGTLPGEVEHLLQVVAIKSLAAAPMWKRSRPGRKASCSRSATTTSPIRTACSP